MEPRIRQVLAVAYALDHHWFQIRNQEDRESYKGIKKRKPFRQKKKK